MNKIIQDFQQVVWVEERNPTNKLNLKPIISRKDAKAQSQVGWFINPTVDAIFSHNYF